MINYSSKFILFTIIFGLGLALDSIAQDAQTETAKDEVEKTLTGFHLAASKADGKKYFGYLAPDAIFLGTDAKERWTVAEFKAYAEPYFNQGKGWTYVASERHIYMSPDKQFAWFDERLQNSKYGEVRGSGVLVKKDGRWLISQYNMSFPVPNEVTVDLLKLIQAASEEK